MFDKTDMYLVGVPITRFIDIVATLNSTSPFDGFNRPDLIDKVKRIEVWGTTFTHQGPDYCVRLALDGEGKILASRRVQGY